MSVQINSSTINETFIIEGQEPYSGDCSAVYTDLIEACSGELEINSPLKLNHDLSASTGYIDSLHSNIIQSSNIESDSVSATTYYGDGSNLTGIDTSFTSKFVVKSGDTMTGTLYLPVLSATTLYGDGSNLTGIVNQINGKFVHLSGDTMTGQLKAPSVSASTYYNVDHNNTINRNSLDSHPSSAITNVSTVITGNTINDVLNNSLRFTEYTGNIFSDIQILSIIDGNTVLITSGNILNYINTSDTFVNVSGDTMTGQLKAPSVSATTYYNIDHNNSTNNKQGGSSGEYYHLTSTEYSLVSGNTLDSRYVNVTGETMTGQLNLPVLSATTLYGDGSNLTGIKGYYLPLTGGTLTGQLNLPILSATTLYGDGSNLTGIVNQINGKFVHLSGDTMTGQLKAPSVSATTLYGDGSNLTGIDHNNVINRNLLNSHPSSAITNVSTAVTGNTVNDVLEESLDFTDYTGNISSSAKIFSIINGNTVLITGGSILNYINTTDTFVNVSGDTMTGNLTVPTLYGNTVSATTISGTTLYGDGSNLTGIVGQINGKFVHLSGDTMTGQLKAPSISADTYYGTGSALVGLYHNTVITGKQGGTAGQYYHLTLSEYSQLTGTALDLRYVNVTGDTMTGQLNLPVLSATTISGVTLYGDGSNLTGIVGQINGKFVHLSGDTMTGQLKAPSVSATTYYGSGSLLTGLDHNTVITGKQGGVAGQYYHLTQAEYSNISGNTLDSRYVNVTGDTMSGQLKAPNFSATTMNADQYLGSGRYLTGLSDALNGYFVRMTGDIMSGNLGVPTITANSMNITGSIYNTTGDVVVNDNLKVSGDLLVLGNTVTVNTEQMLVEDNLLTLNNGETGSTVTKGISGIEIDRGSGDKYNFLFVESAQTFSVGIEGGLQPVATREDNPLNTGYAVWDSSNNRFNTTKDIFANIVTAVNFYGNGSNISGLDHNTVITGKQGGSFGQYYHLTQAEYGLVSGNTLDSRYVNVSGDTMTGQLKAPSISATTLYGDGTNITGLEQSLKYAFVNITGDTMIGQLNTTVLSADTVVARLFIGDGSGIYNLSSNHGLLETFVNVSGDTMTGDLTVPSLIANDDIIINSLSGTSLRQVLVNNDGKLIASDFIPKNSITGITGSSIIDIITDTEIDGCVWDYVIKSSSGKRAGTITGVWDLSLSKVEYYEITTNDIGDTTGVSLSVSIGGGQPKLIMSPDSGSWSIKVVKNEL